MVTRCLGDFDMKKYGLSSDPEIKEHSKVQNKIVIMASDGVWDVFNEKKILDLINQYQENFQNLPNYISKKAIEMGSKDNISIIIVKI